MATRNPPNHLLRALPAAELEALRPHPEIVELVRESVLVEAGRPLMRVYLPHRGVISMLVRPSGAQAIEVATVGRDRSAAFRILLARHAQALFAHAQQSAACNVAHSVEARLSRWLLRARDLCDDESLPLT